MVRIADFWHLSFKNTVTTWSEWFEKKETLLFKWEKSAYISFLRQKIKLCLFTFKLKTKSQMWFSVSTSGVLICNLMKAKLTEKNLNHFCTFCFHHKQQLRLFILHKHVWFFIKDNVKCFHLEKKTLLLLSSTFTICLNLYSFYIHIMTGYIDKLHVYL